MNTIPPVMPVTPTNKTVYRIKDKVLNLYSIRFFIGEIEPLKSPSPYYEGTATVLAFLKWQVNLQFFCNKKIQRATASLR